MNTAFTMVSLERKLTMERHCITFAVVLSKMHLLNLIVPTSDKPSMQGIFTVTGLFLPKASRPWKYGKD